MARDDEYVRKQVGEAREHRPLDVVYRLRASLLALTGKERLPNDDEHIRKLIGRSQRS